MTDLIKSPIPCLSLMQPWAGLVATGQKDVENRTWRTSYRGWLLIHASKTEDFGPSAGEAGKIFGAIIGIAYLYDIVPDDSPLVDDNEWANGPQCWLLRNAQLLPPLPTRGYPSLWYPQLPESYLNVIDAAIALAECDPPSPTPAPTTPVEEEDVPF